MYLQNINIVVLSDRNGEKNGQKKKSKKNTEQKVVGVTFMANE